MLIFLKRGAQLLLGLVILGWLVTLLVVKFERHQYTQITAEQRTQASNYLQGKVTPAPNNLQYQTFIAEPGVALRTATIDVESAKGTVVFVPGFTGTIEMSMQTISQLNKAGFRVAAIEYRGQGKSYRPISNPEKGYVEDFALLASDLAKFARHVKRDGEPLFFFSISKGAHITMRMAAEQGVDVSAFALVVPMIQINTGDLDYSFVKRLAHTLNALGLGRMYAPGNAQWPPQPLVFGEANGCNSNPQTAQLQSAMFTLDETLRTRGATIKWLKETTDSTDKLLSPGFMSALTQPVKIFTAGDDRLVRSDVATMFCSSLSNCEVTHFEEARHCINRESQERMNEIIRQSVEHYEKQLVDHKLSNKPTKSIAKLTN
jgi:lysophospholipase